VPKVIDYGDSSRGSYLVTEFLKFGGSVDQAEMGLRLALMHKAPPKVCTFGLDNCLFSARVKKLSFGECVEPDSQMQHVATGCIDTRFTC
jgi:fructosamine-3-kinase